jgi:anti-sigma factor RsiW
VKRPSRPQTVASSSQAAHPELEELIDYYHEKLDSTAASRVRAHLADCRECTALVLDLEDFVQAESSPPMPEEIREARLVARAVTWEARVEKLRKASLMAASLFLAVSVPLGIYFWGHGKQETSEVASLTPEVNLPLLSLYPRSALRGARENRLEIPAGTRWFHVVLTTDDLPPAADYQLVIVNAAGREVLSLDGLRPTPVGTFSIGLPAARVPDGTYELHLLRRTDGKKALVHEYPLEIVTMEGAGPQATAGQEPN